ncbi:MAG: hypothetical protein QOF78_1238 [Phycisphaerales bacterium]|jgi:hypothetical protein|nr:hypothetical protein [Phycisphaerales bacterium]
MSNASDQPLLAAARESLAHPLRFSEFLAKLSPKDRASAERRVTVLDAATDAPRAELWQRLACSLMTLAPFAAKLVGKQTLQIYVADGKYRMQVFALEDLQDGNFTVYCPDVLDDAVKSGLLSPARTPNSEPHDYVTGSAAAPLRVERLDGKTLHPPAHIKDLTGWNRKALRITLPPAPSPEQVEAAELLCAIAAQRFVRVPPPSGAPIAKS